MYQQIQLTFKSPNEQPINSTWAYNLYGALMEKTAPEFANTLHAQGLKPISQFLSVHEQDESSVKWTINLIGEDAISNISKIFRETDSLYIDKYNTTLEFTNKHIGKVISEKEFTDKFLMADHYNKKIAIKFLAPCSFKSKDEYVIIPTPELIVKSAIQKWNVYAKGFTISDAGLIDDIVKSVKISKYALESISYPLKKIYIPAFTGKLTLQVDAPENISRIFNMLIHYLEISGIGIKCSLGMGGFRIIK